MKKVTVLCGPLKSAEKCIRDIMLNERKTLWTFLQPRLFYEIDVDTQIVVIVGVQFPGDLQRILSIIYCDQVTAYKKGENSQQLPRPEIIFTTESPIKALPKDGMFSRRVKVIEIL